MKSDLLTNSYLALREKLFRSALGFLKDEEDAKDAMQDAFTNLWSKNPVTSDSEAGNKLFTALKNRCIDMLRSRARQNPVVADLCQPMVHIVEEDMEKYENLLISNLSDRQREVYRYVVQEGIEYERIAVMTGRSVESIRTEMSRIRKKIHSNLKKLDL